MSIEISHPLAIASIRAYIREGGIEAVKGDTAYGDKFQAHVRARVAQLNAEVGKTVVDIVEGASTYVKLRLAAMVGEPIEFNVADHDMGYTRGWWSPTMAVQRVKSKTMHFDGEGRLCKPHNFGVVYQTLDGEKEVVVLHIAKNPPGWDDGEDRGLVRQYLRAATIAETLTGKVGAAEAPKVYEPKTFCFDLSPEQEASIKAVVDKYRDIPGEVEVHAPSGARKGVDS